MHLAVSCLEQLRVRELYDLFPLEALCHAVSLRSKEVTRYFCTLLSSHLIVSIDLLWVFFMPLHTMEYIFDQATLIPHPSPSCILKRSNYSFDKMSFVGPMMTMSILN